MHVAVEGQCGSEKNITHSLEVIHVIHVIIVLHSHNR